MGAENDQRLKELYREAREDTPCEVPDFDEVWRAAQTKRGAQPRRGWISQQTLAAAAFVLAAAALVIFGQRLLIDDEFENPHGPAVVHQIDSEPLDTFLLDEDTEDLLFAMSDGAGFTDFLLLGEDSFFAED